jgi:peptide/nickel transport system permease protein
MRSYILRRLLILFPTILLVSLIVFFLVDLMPGDGVDAMLAQGGVDMEFDRAALEEFLGLDAPKIVQYGRWLGVAPQKDGEFKGILQGDFGVSWRERIPVLKLLSLKWPVTLELGFLALIIAQLIALPTGILSALRQDKWPDYVARSIAILFISLPGFWVGMMVIVIPSILWGYMPPIMLVRFFENPIGNLQMFLVAAVVLGMSMTGMTMRMTRTMMLEVLRQDYIRTAWSKGLMEKVITIRHALKNALIPVITVIGFQVPMLVGGTVIIERIFNLPGVGSLLIGGAQGRDQPLVSGVLLFFGTALVLINLLVDLTYGFLDPRVKYS